ncbi:MAG: dihydroxyacetone kinase subunit DhaK [Clostridiales bacterium]|nr:dihydroxyacetone kinase subunit DhaK [Clostridiales bacterium]
MKKLINQVDRVVRESLEGEALAFPHLVKLNEDPLFLYRADAPRPKVALISGGGSGHEPLHGGYVGRGMLDAACPGEVFTSPVPDQMVEAGKKVHGGKGILFIVKNYTGDVMNFEMAQELLEAEGIPVKSVLVADDVAVENSLYTAGRRGVGGTVFVERIAGAAAEKGADLEEVARIAEKVSQGSRSMGMALSSCTVPAKGSPTFELGDDEMEIGIGIHGEPGRERMKLKSADEITEMLARPVMEDLGLRRGEKVIAMVNGMGGTPLMELFIVYRKLHQILEAEGIAIARSLVGNYITSLEMQGASITLLRADEELLQLWDEPVHTPALRWGV